MAQAMETSSASEGTSTDQIHEYEEQLECLLCTCKYTFKRAFEYMCLCSDIARTAHITDPNIAFSAILSTYSTIDMERISLLVHRNNQVKIYDRRRSLKESIIIDQLDMSLLKQFQNNLSVFPSCRNPYQPLPQSEVLHRGAECLERRVCCSTCLYCVRCFNINNNSCRFRNISRCFAHIVKVRNRKAHMEYGDYEIIKQQKMSNVSGPEITEWNADLNNCKRAIRDLLSMMVPTYISRETRDKKIFEFDLVLNTRREVFRQHFTTEYNICFKRTKLEIRFECSSKHRKLLGDIKNVISQPSKIIQINFGLCAISIVSEFLQINKDSLIINLDEFNVKTQKNTSALKIKVKLNIKSDEDNIPSCFERITKDQLSCLIKDLTNLFDELVNKTMQKKLSLTCVGYKYKSLHLYFDMSLPEDVTKEEQDVIKKIVKSVIITQEFSQILYSHLLDHCTVSIDCNEDEQDKDIVTATFGISTFTKEATERLTEMLVDIRKHLKTNLLQVPLKFYFHIRLSYYNEQLCEKFRHPFLNC